MCYDASGNLLSDGTGTGSQSFTYDSEGHMTSISSPSGGSVIATYQYNAVGQRVQASGTGVGTHPVFQYYDAFGNLGYHGDLTTWGYAPFPPVAGKVYGKYAGRTLFIHSNALGSTGTTTWQDGTWGNSEIYDPWGQRWGTSGTLWAERFAGLQKRDAESGLDPTPNRMLTSSYGRWLTPDPLAGDVSNPQSLNRYAYVMNNPTNLVDPLGLDCQTDFPGQSCFDVLVTAPAPGFSLSTMFCFLGFGYCGGSTPQQEYPNTQAPPSQDTGGGDGGSGSGTPAPAKPPASTPCGNTGWLHGGAGITAGGNVDLGAIYTGATAAASQSGGLFYDNNTGFSSGSASTDVALAYFGSHVAPTPSQSAQPVVAVGYAGAGFSVFFTNARSVQQLSGPFQTESVNVGFGQYKFSVQWATGGNVKVLSIGPPYAGGSIGFSVSRTTTNTATQQKGCGPG